MEVEAIGESDQTLIVLYHGHKRRVMKKSQSDRYFSSKEEAIEAKRSMLEHFSRRAHEDATRTERNLSLFNKEYPPSA